MAAVAGTTVAMVVGGSRGWRYGIDHTPVFGCGCWNPVGELIVFMGGLVGLLAGCAVGAAVPALLGLVVYVRRHQVTARSAEPDPADRHTDDLELRW